MPIVSEQKLAILYTVILLAASLLSYVLSAAFIRLSYRFNLLDIPTERKAHPGPTPFLGGAAVFVSFWLVVIIGVTLANLIGREWIDFSKGKRIFQGVMSMSSIIRGIFFGSLIIWVVGFLDDKFHLKPIQKLIGQVLAAFVLLHLGLKINLFYEWGLFGDAVTFIWVILIINAFNFIDSLDGHCSGVAFISAVAFFWITQIINQPLVGFFLVCFAGALIGFLKYNFKPARIFLGDNGSLFIGYMMAAFTLLCKYQSPQSITHVTFFIPVLIFGVPIYDTLSVIVVRLSRGIAPWQGDRNHFAHRLVKMGMSHRAAVIFSYFVQLTIGIIAVLTTQVTFFGSILIGLLFVCIISVIAFLEYYASLRVQIAETLARGHRRRREDIQSEEERRIK